MKRTVIPNRLQGAAIDELEGIVDMDGYGCTWRLWLHTADWQHGTYLLLYKDGKIEHVTETEADGVTAIVVKPANT
jgi:hypothetical protein